MNIYEGKAWVKEVKYNPAQYNSVEGVDLPAVTTVELTVFLSGNASELVGIHRCKVQMIVEFNEKVEP